MRTLSVELRNQLARTVLEARKAAEKGARQALEALAIHHHEPFGSMSKEDRDLRIRLRAHGRQLGDAADPDRRTVQTRALAPFGQKQFIVQRVIDGPHLNLAVFQETQ
jgi:hypothetical protein